MPTDVVMPQMGESIAEGTIVRWIKKVGDTVDRDEPLFEISTDKVDAEIPSPAAGVVSEIRAQEGETVAVNSVVAVIGGATPKASAEAGAAAKAPAPATKPEPHEPHTQPVPAAKAQEPPKPEPQADGSSARAAAPAEAGRPVPTAAPAPAPHAKPSTTEEAIRQRSSPLVRKIAKENNVDIS